MDIIGISDTTRKIAAQAKALSGTNDCAAIVGEVGTGKGYIARIIHQNSKREAEPFIVLDIATCKNIEEELFGGIRTNILGRKSVTSGAIDKAGSGTLFIKNLEEISFDLQPQILATVQLGGYKPTGSNEALKSFCRFIFGLSQKPEDLLAQRKLLPELSDLFARNTIVLPSLKNRAEDIEVLVYYLTKKWCMDLGYPVKKLTKSALKLLKNNSWHGNISELQHVLLNAILHTTEDEIDTHHLQLKAGGNWGKYTNTQIEQLGLEEIVETKLRQFMQRLGKYEAESIYDAIIEHVERPLIKIVMERSKKNQLKAAKILGINRNTLRTKLKKLDMLDNIKRE